MEVGTKVPSDNSACAHTLSIGHTLIPMLVLSLSLCVAVTVIAQRVMRVFLEDMTMKTLPIAFPCDAQALIDAMKKKQPLVDTSNYGIFEYKDKTRTCIPLRLGPATLSRA
jgi:hypothetical protein